MRATLFNNKALTISLLGILSLNSLADIFLGAIAFGDKNLVLVAILAIAFAVQGMFITRIARSSSR